MLTETERFNITTEVQRMVLKYQDIPGYTSCSQRNYRWPYFDNEAKIISETICLGKGNVQTGNCYRVLSVRFEQFVFIQSMV